jgi:hypothetical protein
MPKSWIKIAVIVVVVYFVYTHFLVNHAAKKAVAKH